MKRFSLTYYAKVKNQNDMFIVTFRDFENVFSEGETLEEALFNAQDALDGTLITMAELDLPIKLPSAKQRDEYPVSVSVDLAASILLHIVRMEENKTLADVARAMDKPYQYYQRLENLGENMTLKKLKQASIALGADVELVFTVRS